jgi:hypothetical protein
MGEEKIIIGEEELYLEINKSKISMYKLCYNI